MTHDAMRATHLTLVKLKRKEKRKRKKNGEKERRGQREGKWAPPSLYDLWRSGSQGLKLEYMARATHVYRKLQFFRGFTWEVREVKSFGFRKCSRDFLGAIWLSFNALKSCLALFALKGCLAN